MQTFVSEDLRSIVKDAAKGNAEVAARVDDIDFLEIKNLEESVQEDVAWATSEPLLLPETTVTGWIYDVKTGKVSRVA
jgi:carbonic anhydrase